MPMKLFGLWALRTQTTNQGLAHSGDVTERSWRVGSEVAFSVASNENPKLHEVMYTAEDTRTHQAQQRRAIRRQLAILVFLPGRDDVVTTDDWERL